MLPIAEVIGGIQVVLSGGNLLFIGFGVLAGTFVGAMPGLGASTGVALLLSVVFGMDFFPAIFMLIGVYTGATFGGAISSILLNTPGTPAATLTALEGYKLTEQGQAGPALGIAALSSFIGLLSSAILMVLFSPILVRFAITFGAAEYTMLIFLGLSTLAFIGNAPGKLTLISGSVGFFVGVMGMDPMGGFVRFTFGSDHLIDGLSFVPVAMGLFAVAEVLINMEKEQEGHIVKRVVESSSVFPSRALVRSSFSAQLKASVVGFFVGILPAAGQTIAAFLSYTFVYRTSKTPERFGHGSMEGLAASEAGNSASTGGALLPTLTLGIPGSGTTAMILSAMVMFGVRPGPLLFVQNPEITWGIMVSLVFCAVFLYLLNGPLVPYLSKVLLALPYSYVYPSILVFVFVGAYALYTTTFNVFVVIFFGILGYLFQKLGIPRAPLLLALVLGPMFESSLRQAIQLGRGSLVLFYTRPIPLILFAVAIVLLTGPGFYRAIVRKKRTITHDRHDRNIE